MDKLRPNRRRRFDDLARLLMLMLILGFLSGCALKSVMRFRNPDFTCPSPDLVEPDQGYPPAGRVFPPAAPQGESAVAQIKEFCTRMRRRFANSNMTVQEAEDFYTLLEAANGKALPDGVVLRFRNGFYGMPGPRPPQPFVFDRQIMLKKLAESQYEMFYYYIESGRNYVHVEVHADSGGIKQFIVLESWSEFVPV